MHPPPTSGDPPAPPGALRLSMSLDLAVTAADLFAAEELVGEALALDLELADDLELGGPHFVYAAADAAADGLCSVRLLRNEIAGFGWLHPRHREVPYVAEVGLVGDDLLELGRIAATVEARCGDAVWVLAYRVVGDFLGDGERRLLGRDFASPHDAASRWAAGHARRAEAEAGGALDTELLETVQELARSLTAAATAATATTPESEAEQRDAFRQILGKLPRLLEQLGEDRLEAASQDPEAWAEELYQEVLGGLENQRQAERRERLADEVRASIAKGLRSAGIEPVGD